MGRPRKKAIEPQSPIPDYIQAAPIMAKRKITKRKLPSYTEAMTLLHMPELQRKFWECLYSMLDSRDKTGLERAGEIIGLLKEKGGITITQQMMAQTTVAGADSPVIGADAFIRQLAEARSGHALPPPSGVDFIVEASVVRPADSEVENGNL